MPGRRMGWLEKSARTRSDLVLRSGLPAWIIRALRESGVKRLSVMSHMSDAQILLLPGIGKRSLSLIRAEIERVHQGGMEPNQAAGRETHGTGSIRRQ